MEEVKVIVNPYNFNNKLITENDVKKILSDYDIDDTIFKLDNYQLAFVHSSYSKKSPIELGENVVIAEKPEGALELMDADYERLEFLGMFEAFVGAMFLDFNEIDNYNLLDNFYSGIGFQICEKFIINVIEEHVDFFLLILKNTNYKEQLSKYFNETYKCSIKFSEPEVDGGLNDRLYTVNVLDLENNVIGVGIGKSKKKAEQYACKDSLIKLNSLT